MNKGIQAVFAQVPETYERVNHILTLGLDILWRRRLARRAAAAGGARWMDICSGTGETACLLQALAPAATRVAAVDFSLPMLSKLREKPCGEKLLIAVGDASSLPFDAGAFDLVTLSFATRNLNTTPAHLTACFSEFCRVLKPGGRFLNLETSQPRSRLLRRLYHLYVRIAVRQVGAFISGSTTAYAYLAHTIPRFHDGATLSDILKTAGFARVEHHPMLFGVAAIHVAVK